jgi:hypothetical protein
VVLGFPNWAGDKGQTSRAPFQDRGTPTRLTCRGAPCGYPMVEELVILITGARCELNDIGNEITSLQPRFLPEVGDMGQDLSQLGQLLTIDDLGFGGNNPTT